LRDQSIGTADSNSTGIYEHPSFPDDLIDVINRCTHAGAALLSVRAMDSELIFNGRLERHCSLLY
jgi:hypothetical protein